MHLLRRGHGLVECGSELAEVTREPFVECHPIGNLGRRVGASQSAESGRTVFATGDFPFSQTRSRIFGRAFRLEEAPPADSRRGAPRPRGEDARSRAALRERPSASSRPSPRECSARSSAWAASGARRGSSGRRRASTRRPSATRRASRRTRRTARSARGRPATTRSCASSSIPQKVSYEDAAEGLLGEPRPDAGHAPGQRRRHAVPLGHLRVRRGAAGARPRPRGPRTRRSSPRRATARSRRRSSTRRSSTTPRTTTSSTSRRTPTATAGSAERASPARWAS